MSTDLYRFNFKAAAMDGYTHVTMDPTGEVPLYSDAIGYGFIAETCSKPPRETHTRGIKADGTGFSILEPTFYTAQGNEEDDYNNYGMAFRLKAAPGAYRIEVKLTVEADAALVSISGMQGRRIIEPGFWDMPMSIPIGTVASTARNVWSFDYANGQGFMDIEIEPREINTPVGIQEIVLTPIPPKLRPEGSCPGIYILGDSTVKTYTFEAAPMAGWGQVIENHFDLDRVRIFNYSMGGRSFKNAYFEGRFNDILNNGHVGDYVFIQFGHNDEMKDESVRFGRGSTEAMYEQYILQIYIPAIRARGMVPVFITPMSRVNGDAEPGTVYENSFRDRKFPEIMRRLGKGLGITVIDLNARSVEYYNEIGVEATTAIVMSIEAGETPGKTNDGSYANGHPMNRNDGTHFKEALAKQFSRMIVTELIKQGAKGERVAAEIARFLKPEVKLAAASGDWSLVFPEIAKDAEVGGGAYYRNQIEKLVQLGLMSKDRNGCFRPEAVITVGEFIASLCQMLDVEMRSIAEPYEDGLLTREAMAAILADAYAEAFTETPRYMTDYNGTTAVPGSPGYDPNLDGGARGAMYFPLVSYEALTDLDEVAPSLEPKVGAAYRLGLIRSESGIKRGTMINGTELEPKKTVTRSKAAKALYFMWVLKHAVSLRNDRSH